MAENEDDVVIPRFFKVFFSETASESMGIPMSFNEHLEDPLPQKAKLQGTGGGVWTVSFTKIRDCAYFTSGWSKFAEDHELKDGEFLTFVYDGHHTFEVSVYGHCGCKETRAVVETVEISDDDDSDENEKEEDSSMDADSDEEEEEVDPSFNAADDDSLFGEVEDDAAGLSYMEVTGNPCFTTKLKQRTYELLIPANVINEHGLTFGDKIKFIDAEGVMKGERGKLAEDRVCFKGWNRICRRNRVREQDTVICEMFHVRKKVHSVKITVRRG
ncbi:B3 DNA binding domain-containing protein [Hirschfeldia incana]|nr:B3 DNA binding domain-containing protein [Hirschfeldia incana]